jgi:hypothetical protein
VLDGLKLAQQVSSRSGLPVKFLAGLEALLGTPEFDDLDVPLLPLKRLLLKPWESSAE